MKHWHLTALLRNDVRLTILIFWFFMLAPIPTFCGERFHTFETDPGWQGINNHISRTEKVCVTQGFGYSESQFAGRGRGELGGLVTRASEPAFYADNIAPCTLVDPLEASGSFAFTKTTGSSGVFFGFFCGEQPGGSGRPVSSLGMDFDCEATGARLAVRLITARNQTCGTFITPFISGKFRPTPIRNDGTRYHWTLRYDPHGAGNRGRFTFTLRSDDHRGSGDSPPDLPEAHKNEWRTHFPQVTTFTVDLPEGFKEQGTTFDHFGLMNMLKPGGHLEVFFDDLEFQGKTEDFSRDPAWVGSGNRCTYEPMDMAGAQDFGFRQTQLAGGVGPGEIGGTFWRTEGPVASYADRVKDLSLNDKLSASGRLAFTVGSPDSGMFLGWFNSKTVDQAKGLRDFVGVRIEGPTHAGHYFAPVVATSDGLLGKLEIAPILVPGRNSRQWSIDYDPDANGGDGNVTVRLDEESATLKLKRRGSNARLDRFGFFTLRVGGSQLKLYLDDLRYTADKAPDSR